jgi:hypothetical protein
MIIENRSEYTNAKTLPSTIITSGWSYAPPIKNASPKTKNIAVAKAIFLRGVIHP